MLAQIRPVSMTSSADFKRFNEDGWWSSSSKSAFRRGVQNTYLRNKRTRSPLRRTCGHYRNGILCVRYMYHQLSWGCHLSRFAKFRQNNSSNRKPGHPTSEAGRSEARRDGARRTRRGNAGRGGAGRGEVRRGWAGRGEAERCS